MDRLEAQYGGYFIKNIRKIAFFWKKVPKNLQVSKNILIFATEKSPGWRYDKNNKNWVAIKSHNI